MRLFVGIELPAALSTSLETALGDLRQDGSAWAREKWVPTANLHVTSCFIGEVAQGALTPLRDALAEAAVGVRAFELVPRRIVAHPGVRHASMLWLSFDDPSHRAADLAARLTEAAVPFGAAPTGRTYTPHATLCRARRPRLVDAQVLARATESIRRRRTAVSVVSCTLFSSRLTPSGPVYERVGRLRLKESAG